MQIPSYLSLIYGTENFIKIIHYNIPNGIDALNLCNDILLQTILIFLKIFLSLDFCVYLKIK